MRDAHAARQEGYRVEFGEPWEDFPSEDAEADTRRMNAWLEAVVRTMPEQYYWVHRRFKTVLTARRALPEQGPGVAGRRPAQRKHLILRRMPPEGILAGLMPETLPSCPAPDARDPILALTILGLSGALTHDPSAALYIDGKLVAAAEEERFVRDKHAKNRMPYEAAKFCLEFAGLKPGDVDAVAIPFSPISLAEKARWHYAKRYWYAPDRSLDAILTGNRRYFRYKKRIEWCLQQLGFDLKKIEIVPVEHHLAHASSAYHCSGFTEKTAILGIDGKGEYATTFFGVGENGKITKIKEFYDPDSLGGLYGALTEYLGFEMLDGEYKVMGMAPTATRPSTISRAWRSSRTASWSSTPTTPT